MSVEKLEINLETGEVYRTVTEPVTNPTPLLSRLAKHAVTSVPISRTLSYVLDNKNNKGFGLVRLDEIAMNTSWFLSNDDTSLSPFIPVYDSTQINAVVRWKFDTSAVVPLFVCTLSVSEGCAIQDLGSCYLFFVDKESGEFYAPPLPNVYDDGRLCTGNLPLSGVETSGFVDYVTDVVQTWSSNKWNLDLFSDETKRAIVKRIFRIDSSTLKQEPVKECDKYWFREYGIAGFVPGDSPNVQKEVVREAFRLAGVFKDV